jgi:hypothetical protein
MSIAQIDAYWNKTPDPGQRHTFDSDAENRKFTSELQSRREQWIEGQLRWARSL